MMLRKRSRPAQKDHSGGPLMTDSASESSFSSDAARKPRNTSFFTLPGLFVGFAKGMADSDSARSPISPLDYKVFSSLGSHFARSPRSPGFEGPRKSWECDRVGLGLVDSLNDECKPCGSLLGSSESRNILFGSQMKVSIPSPRPHLDHLLQEGSATSPKSLPKNYVISSRTRIGSPLRSGSSEKGPAELPPAHLDPGVLGKIRSCSADMGRSLMGCKNLSSEVIRCQPRKDTSISLSVGGLDFESSSGSLPITRGLMGSLSAGDIEQSEDYTCIISHGPNPKTIHIFGDCILERHTSDSSDFVSNKQGEEGRGSSWMVKCSEDPMPFPSEGFLSVCYSCKKKLDGKDIYMYRGEKAFCSCSCRSQEIMDEEEMEGPATDCHGSPSSTCSEEEIFLPGSVVAV
uniref:PCP degradation transcriptional activation protein n=1 Tax=Anthurium amnicola TaxID=1678845 RepID=A0A1D1YI72_9ARAE